jgi:Dolichyl-phosphate-mannose-protein mannosyltransferase
LLGGLAVVVLLFCFRGTIRGDGVGYYGYLPSIFAHRTLDLGPTFDRFIAINTPVSRYFLEITLPNGLTADYKQVGAALLALPFYLITHLIFVLVPGRQDPDVSAEYQLAFTAASLFYGLLALVLIYRFARQLFGRPPAVMATAGILLATPLVAYLVFEPSYSHTFSVFATTAFALYLYASRHGRTTTQWFVAGLLGGLAAITHAQEVLFFVLVPAEAAWQIWHHQWRPHLIPKYAALLVGALLAIVPQLAIDRLLFERWLPPTAPNISFDFAHPHLLDLLVSTRHGWLAWSPLVAVAFLGLPSVIRRFEWFGVGLVAAGVLEFVVNAALSDWWGGASFGSRRLTDQSLLLGLGLAATCAWLLRHRLALVAVGVVAAGIGWSGLLLAQFYYIIRADATPSWHDFLRGQLRAVGYVPRLFAQGAVFREALMGHLLLAAYSAVVVAGVTAVALWVGSRLELSHRPGGKGTPDPAGARYRPGDPGADAARWVAMIRWQRATSRTASAAVVRGSRPSIADA